VIGRPSLAGSCGPAEDETPPSDPKIKQLVKRITSSVYVLCLGVMDGGVYHEHSPGNSRNRFFSKKINPAVKFFTKQPLTSTQLLRSNVSLAVYNGEH
jgi:hypothetical protein